MGHKKSCACYDCRGDYTYEIEAAVTAARRAGWRPGSGTVPDAAAEAFDKSWNESMKARDDKKGR